jgi:broad specificity phosphatase PhoE
MRLSLIRRLTLTQYSEQYEDQTVVAVSHGGFIANALITLFDILARAQEPGWTPTTQDSPSGDMPIPGGSWFNIITGII